MSFLIETIPVINGLEHDWIIRNCWYFLSFSSLFIFHCFSFTNILMPFSILDVIVYVSYLSSVHSSLIFSSSSPLVMDTVFVTRLISDVRSPLLLFHDISLGFFLLTCIYVLFSQNLNIRKFHSIWYASIQL